MTIELVYETHSTTEDNEHGIATGWLPGRLSAEGRRQAIALGVRRRNTGLDLVFTSDLARAVETTTIAFAGAGLPVQQDRRLRECDYGALNGAPVASIAARRLRSIAEPFPGGQSYLDVVAATSSFLADLVTAHAGARVLVVAHSANRWALQHLLEGTPLRDLVAAPFEWQPGWTWQVSTPWGADRA